MSYISHSEFKNLMSKFQAETPKGMLKEAINVKDRGYQDNITPESPLDEKNEMEEGWNFDEEGEEHSLAVEKELQHLAQAGKIDAATLDKALDYVSDHDYELYAHNLDANYVLKQVTGVEEGNAFTGQLHKHKPGEKFKVGDKEFKDTAKGVVPEYRFDQMYPEDPGPFEESNLNEEGNYSKIIPALKAKGITHDMPKNEIFKAIAEVMKELGYTPQQIRGNMYDHDFLPDLLHMLKQSEKKQDMPGFGGTHDALDKLSIREDDMEENIYEPLQKATGPTIMQKEDMTGRFEVLSPDERKQLKEYIESLKTIKKEIATLLEKAGKSNMMESDKAGYVKGSEIKNKKKETDTKHPATIKAKYHEPTHKQKTGGDRTNLVMKKGEMWESHEPDMDPKHEEMESKIDPKLHDVLHKVADKVISELEAAGFTRQEALMFLDHEIAEKGEEAKMDQYNPF